MLTELQPLVEMLDAFPKRLDNCRGTGAKSS